MRWSDGAPEHIQRYNTRWSDGAPEHIQRYNTRWSEKPPVHIPGGGDGYYQQIIPDGIVGTLNEPWYVSAPVIGHVVDFAGKVQATRKDDYKPEGFNTNAFTGKGMSPRESNDAHFYSMPIRVVEFISNFNPNIFGAKAITFFDIGLEASNGDFTTAVGEGFKQYFRKIYNRLPVTKHSKDVLSEWQGSHSGYIYENWYNDQNKGALIEEDQ